MRENALLDKSKQFALDIIKLFKMLTEKQNEYILSKQILRSGTSIGANIKEGQFAQSRADFYSKMYIAFKEAGETEYWLDLLYESNYISEEVYNGLHNNCQELIKMLAAVTKTQKDSNTKERKQGEKASNY